MIQLKMNLCAMICDVSVCVLKLMGLLVVMEKNHTQNKGLQTHVAVLLCSNGLQVLVLVLVGDCES